MKSQMKSQMKSLYESLLDGFDEIEKAQKVSVKDEIYYFLRMNYLRSTSFEISRKPNKDGIYEVTYKNKAPMVLKNKKATSVTNGMFKFVGETSGFEANACYELESLEGLPDVMLGDFKLLGCEKLKSLKGAPKKIDGEFCCGRCDSLENLEGMSQEGVTRLSLYDCGELKSLKGSTNDVLNLLISRCDQLDSLKGGPQNVMHTYTISSCKNLTSLEGSPKEINGNYEASWLPKLTSLKGITQKAGGYTGITVSNTGIKNLEGLPKTSLSLKILACHELNSFKGCPQTVYGNLTIKECPEAEDFDNLPTKVHGSLSIYTGNKTLNANYIKSVTEADKYYINEDGMWR